jgi:hypothetical protein
MRRVRVAAGVGLALAVPALAEAHSISGSGGWADELICLVPAVLLLVAVLLLGRDDRSKQSKKGQR